MILEQTIAVNLITSGMTRDDKQNNNKQNKLHGLRPQANYTDREMINMSKFCKTILLLFEK
jgi:hypothetical protein